LPLDAHFEVITVIDVIEHVTDPASLLSAAYARLTPGGKIIVSTGDPRCPWWRRVFRSKFWYASFPEHVSFPSLAFCRGWCERNNARIGERRVVRRQSLGRWRISWSFLAQVAFYISPSAFNWVGRAAARFAGRLHPSRRTYSPGIPGVFFDHHILVIERPF
jgi:SAM-dependent methyltransferase